MMNITLIFFDIYLRKYQQDIWKILIKVKILLYLHMDKLVQEKHILCLVILKINKNLVLYLEHYKEYLIQIIITIWYHVLCYKSIIKKLKQLNPIILNTIENMNSVHIKEINKTINNLTDKMDP